MTCRYQLRTSDGALLGEGEWPYPPAIDDQLIVADNRLVRVMGYPPAERISEFAAKPGFGLIEVELL